MLVDNDPYKTSAVPGATVDPNTATATATAPPVTAAPAAPATSVQTAPGYTPDYGGLIQSDPTYLTAKAAADNAQRQAAAQRKAQLQQAIIQYGGLPAGFSDQYGDIDQATQDQASQNQYSVLANLGRNYSQNEEQFKRGLAARGALQSGDYNYGADQLTRAYGQQRYDAANAVGSQANQSLNSYMGVLTGNAQNLSGAIQGAEANVYSNPAYRPAAAKSANYDAHNSATYGQPIYVDDGGNLFDMNGNPYSPPSVAPAAAPGTTPNYPSSNAYVPSPMNANGTSAPVAQVPYTPGPADANGVPISAGFYGFDANGKWIG